MCAMPYRYANVWVGLTLVVIVWGFWGSYFQTDAEIPLGFHVHAISALLWVGLLGLQHWSIHHRQRALHKRAGQLSLLLFPFLIAGFVMIINISASKYAADASPFIAVAGPSFALAMLMAIGIYLVLYYLALKHRSNVRLHAGYMLCTPLVLFESPFSRVLESVAPWLFQYLRPFPHGVLDQIAICMFLSAVFAFIVFWRVKRDGRPFLVCGVLLLIEAAAMRWGTELQPLRAAFNAYATVPEWLTVGLGFALGAAAAWAGWTAPSRGGPTPQPLPA
jgi:hypothetical protein